LTALQVAKPQYRIVLEQDAQQSVRPCSSQSSKTVRPQQISNSDSDCVVHASHIALADHEVFDAAARLIDKLRISSPTLHRNSSNMRHIAHLESLILEMKGLIRAVIGYFKTRTQEASDMLKDMEDDVKATADLLESMKHLVERKIEEHGLQPCMITRMSEGIGDRILTSTRESKYNDNGSSKPSPETLQPFITASSTDNSSLSTKNVSQKVSTSPSARFVAWIKRKTSAKSLRLKPPSPMLLLSSHLPAVKSDMQFQMPVTRKELNSSDRVCMSPLSALRTSGSPIGAAGREMDSIRDRMTSINKLLQSTDRSITRAERILKQALKARKTMVENLRMGEDIFFRGPSLSNKSSLASIASTSSAPSLQDMSRGSLPVEGEDEETRVVQLLLFRKIDDGVLADITNINQCLLVIKDVIKGVKQRIYV
ncbi:hypothetical protein EV360DRAFT_77179, partial [Lentinula raphanica]